MRLAELAIEKYKKDGIFSLIYRGFVFMISRMIGKVVVQTRYLFPVRRNAIWNGVEVPSDVAPPYRLTDKYLRQPFTIAPDDPNSEGGEVNGHKNYTQEGDRVVIIGGGRGVTAVTAARCVGDTGKIIVYEGSEEYAGIIRKVTDLNKVQSRVEIRNSLVGPGIKVYGDSEKQTKNTEPAALPDCDVLEMDCEGAEVDIIENITIRPRILIVEVHPQRTPAAKNVPETLVEMGYEIVEWYTNDGKQLDKHEFEAVIEQCSEGDAPAPVVVARYDGK